MATFYGFNTIDQKKKFTLTDFELVKRDFLNALNIQKGEKPGKPDYGTTLWQFIFDNQGPQFVDNIRTELQRVAGGDPRLFIQEIRMFPQDNGVRVEIDVQTKQSTEQQLLNVFFNAESNRASYL